MKRKNTFKWLLLTTYHLSLITLVLSSCTPKPTAEKYTQIGEFFGATVKVDICYQPLEEEKVKAALADVWNRFADIHSRMSIYDPESDINKINRSYPNTISIPEDTYQLIQSALSYGSGPERVFDITISPLIKLWKESAKKNILPSVAEIAQAKAKMGIDKIKLLPDNKIQLLTPDVRLNVDSIGDGYAADVARNVLGKYGFNNYLIDSAGELFARGTNCEGKTWRIGVIDPQDKAKLLDVVYLKDQAVSTSGSYERFYEIKGKKYSHIINPLTGYPANQVMSATVIAPNTAHADFLSTVLCIIPPDEGIKMIEGMNLVDSSGKGFGAMIVVDLGDGKAEKHSSRDYKKYSTQNSELK